ncbi:MAG: membrane protein insertase YidC, partial [Pseudomonadota bacterium]|nr:membrane protein insertase YidC [Pseudomonadota bacterium]
METRQFILFVALAFVLLLIWQNWQQYQQAKNPPPAATAQQNTSAAQNAPGAPAPAASPTVGGEVPAAPAVPAAAVSAPAAESAAEGGEIITVTTDLVRAQISTLGGDLVRVELLEHPVSVDTPDVPFVLMQKSSGEVFIAQSGLIGREGHDYPTHKTQFSATRQAYQLADGADQVEVGLDWVAPDGIKYRKVYRFHRDSYRIDVDFQVANPTDSDWNGYFYGQLQRTEPMAQGGYFGRLPSYTGATIYTPAEHYQKIKFHKMQEEPLNINTPSGWVAMLQHYFFGAWLPSGAEAYQFYSGVSQGGAQPLYRIGYKNATPTAVPAGSEGVVHSALFVGPKEQNRLDAQGVEGLKLVVDYGWLTPVANPLFWLLNKIHSFVGNWGWAIILLTVLVKLLFFPLSA